MSTQRIRILLAALACFVASAAIPALLASRSASADYPTRPQNAQLLQGRAVASTAPTNGQTLSWVAATSKWTPSSAGAGTITAVVAGTGLSGGASSGSATLAIDTAVTVDRTTSQTLTNKTLTTPVIGSFANANHDHTNSAGGGSLGSNVVGATALSSTSLRFVAWQGRNGAGACTATLLKVGDQIVNILNVAGAPVDATSNFEGTVTVNGQIQQSSASNLSAAFFMAVVVAKGG